MSITELQEALDQYNADPDEILQLISEDKVAAERLECALYDLAEYIQYERDGNFADDGEEHF